ncbi:MAG: cytochrome c oxidase subunit II [Sphingobacteriia bacterium]|nr:cytochrome c oxidase subunit II [Sphingobacteriia bacterium]
MKKIGFVLLLMMIALNVAFADYPRPWETYFQEPATPVMERFYKFHDKLLVIITAVSLFVLALLVYACIRFSKKFNPIPSKTTHNVKLEVLWTIIPVFILLYISVPSFKTLYYSDVTPESEMTLKVVGHQWYWEYIYPEQENIAFESYMIKDEDIKPGQIRLLEVDNQVVLPVDTVVKVLITSADVLHSWAIPAFGIKTDAVPGRTNETWMKITKPGVYYGQCSQLCGFGHGFMPIAIKAVSKEDFKQWLEDAKKKYSYNQNSLLSSIN